MRFDVTYTAVSSDNAPRRKAQSCHRRQQSSHVRRLVVPHRNPRLEKITHDHQTLGPGVRQAVELLDEALGAATRPADVGVRQESYTGATDGIRHATRQEIVSFGGAEAAT